MILIPRVSVALCTYNGARHLPQQLATILNQTHLPSELIVSDDRSTDATLTLLEAFARTAPFPVQIQTNRKTLGAAQNFAVCLSRCAGDLILLTDQDDLWLPTRVADTLDAFTANPKLAFTFSDAPLIDAQGNDLHRTIYASLPISAADRRQLTLGRDLLPILLRWGVVYGATMALRASLRPAFLPIPPTWSHDEWIALTLSATGVSARIPPVTSYRQHAAQQVGTGDWSLQTHLTVARLHHDAAFYQRERLRYANAIIAAAANPTLLGTLLPHLEAKHRFLEERLRIHAGGLTQLPRFLRLLRTGQYARYASALRSPLKDLALLTRLHRR